MTRRELINALLDGDMNEEMFVTIANAEEDEETYMINSVDADVIEVSIG